jgi:hypothetical protein
LHCFNRVGKKDFEQHCPDMSGTYNSTELDKVTPTYGGKHHFMTAIRISRFCLLKDIRILLLSKNILYVKFRKIYHWMQQHHYSVLVSQYIHHYDIIMLAKIHAWGIYFIRLMAYWNSTSCSRVIGLGGLGHMGVKIGVAMGAHVTVISTSESKRDDATKLGAKAFIVSKDEEQLKAAQNSFDFIIDTVSAEHDVVAMINLLAFQGVYCM